MGFYECYEGWLTAVQPRKTYGFPRSRAFALSSYKAKKICLQAAIFFALYEGTAHCFREHYTIVLEKSK